MESKFRVCSCQAKRTEIKNPGGLYSLSHSDGGFWVSATNLSTLFLSIMFQVTVWDYDRFGANEFLGKDLIWDLSLNISQTYLFCNSPSVLLAIKQHESKALSLSGWPSVNSQSQWKWISGSGSQSVHWNNESMLIFHLTELYLLNKFY